MGHAIVITKSLEFARAPLKELLNCILCIFCVGSLLCSVGVYVRPHFLLVHLFFGKTRLSSFYVLNLMSLET